MTTRPLGEMAAPDDEDAIDNALLAAASARIAGRSLRSFQLLEDPDSDHAVLLARARRAKLAQWTAFWAGVVLGIGIGVAVGR